MMLKKILSVVLTVTLLAGLCAYTALASDSITIAFIGGSITYGIGVHDTEEHRTSASYAALVRDWYYGKYGEENVTYVNAGLNATGTNLALFRIQDEVLRYNPDVVFVEFAVNDEINKDSAAKKKRQMEGVVQLIMNHNPNTQIVFLYTTSSWLGTDASAHQEIADYYNIPSIDLKASISDAMKQAELTNAAVGKVSTDYFAVNDSYHPNDLGYLTYANRIIEKLETSGFMHAPTPRKETYTGFSVGNPEWIEYNDPAVRYQGKWNTAPGPNNYTDRMPILRVTREAGASVEVTFEGSVFGVYGYLHPSCGVVEYSLDDGEQTGMFLAMYGSVGNPNVMLLLTNLSPGRHTIKLTLTDIIPASSTGIGMQIAKFMVDRTAVYSELTEETETFTPVLDVDMRTMQDQTANPATVTPVQPLIRQMDTVDGETSYFSTLNKGYITVDSDKIRNLKDISVEAWAYIDVYDESLFTKENANGQKIPSYGRLFGISNESAKTEIMGAQYSQENPKTFVIYRLGYGDAAGTSNAVAGYRHEALNSWKHYVFTRSYDETQNTFTYRAYIDGKCESTGTKSGVMVDEADFNLYIGASLANGGDVFPLCGYVGSFSVYDQIVSESFIQSRMQEMRPRFTVVDDAAATMQVVATTPDVSGGQLDANCGKIELLFDNYVKADTLDGITLKKADGGAVKGGVFVQRSVDNYKKVEIRFGQLEENTEYQLEVSAALLATNRQPCTPYTKNFTAKTAYIVNEDFNGENYIVGEEPPEMSGGVQYISGNSYVAQYASYGNTTDITVLENELMPGDKYISMTTRGSNTMAYKMFDTPLNGETVAVDLKVRYAKRDGVIPSNGQSVGRIVYKNKAYPTSDFIDTARIQNEQFVVTKGSDVDSFFQVDGFGDDGFISVRYILKRDEANGYYYAEIYDLNNLSKMPYIMKKEECEARNLYGFMAGHIYASASGGAGTLIGDREVYDRTEISEFKIYTILEPEILKISPYDSDQNALHVTYSADILPADVTGEKMMIKRVSDGVVVSSNVSYDEDTRTVTFMMAQPLVQGERYRVVNSDVTTTDLQVVPKTAIFTGEVTPATTNTILATLTNEQGNPVSSIAGLETVGGMVSVIAKTGTDFRAQAILALYKGSLLVQVCALPIHMPNGGQNTFIFDRISNAALKADTAKIMVWNSALAPLFPQK